MFTETVTTKANLRQIALEKAIQISYSGNNWGTGGGCPKVEEVVDKAKVFLAFLENTDDPH